MSKSITVPDIGYSLIRLQINNNIYELIPGTTQTVPDEVAALLEQIAGSKPQADPDGADLQPASIRDVKRLIESSGGGSGLPEVSAADDGDVLAVVSGKWAKSDPPSGLPDVSAADNGKILGVSGGSWGAVANKDPMIVPFVLEEDGDEYTCSTTASYADVVTAIAARKTVTGEATMALGDDQSIVFRFPLSLRLPTDDEDALIFSGVLDMGEIQHYQITFTSDGCALSIKSIPTKADSAPVIRVPFTLTYDDQNDSWSGSTTADFEDVLEAAKDGSVIVCDAVSEVLGAYSHYAGVMDFINSSESQYVDDEFSVIIPFKANSVTVAGMYIKWLESEVKVNQLTLATIS